MDKEKESERRQQILDAIVDQWGLYSNFEGFRKRERNIDDELKEDTARWAREVVRYEHGIAGLIYGGTDMTDANEHAVAFRYFLGHLQNRPDLQALFVKSVDDIYRQRHPKGGDFTWYTAEEIDNLYDEWTMEDAPYSRDYSQHGNIGRP